MEKITTVNELVNKYKKASAQVRKDAILKSIKSKAYVPYGIKMACMQGIVKDMTFNKNGKIHLNSPMKLVLFTMVVLKMYTDINCNTDNIIGDFDLLNQEGLVDILMRPQSKENEIIPAKEIAECSVILNMLIDDAMTNHYEPHAFVENLVQKIIDTLDEYKPVVDKLMAMDGQETKSLQEKLGAVINTIAKQNK